MVPDRLERRNPHVVKVRGERGGKEAKAWTAVVACRIRVQPATGTTFFSTTQSRRVLAAVDAIAVAHGWVPFVCPGAASWAHTMFKKSVEFKSGLANDAGVPCCGPADH